MAPPPVFPQYLTPPRALASHQSAESSSSLPPTTVLTCRTCRTHLTPSTSVISKTFTGRHGRAYLLSETALSPTTAVRLKPPQQRELVTGMHTVRDFECRVCGQVLGWRYDAAADRAQRYKVGKWILERERVRSVAGCGGGGAGGSGGTGGGGVVGDEVQALLAASASSGQGPGWEMLFAG